MPGRGSVAAAYRRCQGTGAGADMDRVVGVVAGAFEYVVDRGVGASENGDCVVIDGCEMLKPNEREVGNADVGRNEAEALRGTGAGNELDVGVYGGISSSGGLGRPPVNANLPWAYFPSRAARVGAKEIGPYPSVTWGG